MNSPSPASAPPGPGQHPTPEIHRPVLPPPPQPVTGADAARDALCCDRCGHTPADPLQTILMSAQWLIAGPGGPTLARYCRTCPPPGPITDLTCRLCGDGPLLVGDLAAGPDGGLPADARTWLTTTGWHLSNPTGPSCPDCDPTTRHARGARA